MNSNDEQSGSPDPNQNPYSPTDHGQAGQTDAALSDELVHGMQSREYEIGDILSVSFNLFRQNFVDLGVPGLIFGLVTLVVTVLASSVSAGWMMSMMQVSGTGEPDPMAMLSSISEYAPLFLIMALGSLALQAMLAAYTVLRTQACARSGGQKPEIGVTVQEALGVLPLYIGVSVVSVIIVGIGFMLCFLPGIYAAVILALTGPLVAIAKAGFGSITQSIELVKGRFVKTLVSLVAVGLAFYVVIILISLIIGNPAEEQMRIMMEGAGGDPTAALQDYITSPAYIAMQLPGTLIGGLMYSMLSVLSTVMYFNYSRPNQ